MATAAEKPRTIPAGFERRTVKVNGVDVVMHVGGSGPPLVFLHGAGTFTGFNFAAPWAERFKVYLPYHPGFGESPDVPPIGSTQDYALHYLEFFDALKLDKVSLVGLSMGGWIASTLATHSSHRLNKLVLIAPAGLRVREHPATDIFRLKPEEIPPMLAHDVQAILKYLPDPAGPHFFDFLVNNYRETSGWARLAWERNYDPDLPKWLHRIKVPTLLLYGDKDRITPAAQAEAWAELIPGSKVEIIKDAGHLVLDEKPEAARKVLEFLV
jgi:pimeloyl-ACP methyl ester carboxylesterase